MIWICSLNSHLVRCVLVFLKEQLFINVSVSSLCVDNSGICGGIPSCCIVPVSTAALCEEIPVPPPEAWGALLFLDDGDISVSEVGEIGSTGSCTI